MASGNSEVVELLEAYLETARKNSFGHIAIAMTGHPNIAALDFAGEISLERSSREALGLLTGKLDASIANWTLPPADPSLDASYVCYNVANGPLGYDFLIWLVDAEMTRRREGAAGPLKVGFWLGHDAADRVNLDQRKMWLERVFRPLLPMIGAIEDSLAVRGRCKEVYVPRDIVAAARAGEAVPQLRSRCQRRFPEAVTITLREAGHWSHRNSNLTAWLQFAHLLRERGERVVFIRDTCKAYEPLGDFVTDPLASIDIDHRMALYESAKCNLFVSNGPSGLALFGDRPWLTFVPVEDEANPKYHSNTRKAWIDGQGVEPGGQWPWARSVQRMVWSSDHFEAIVAAYDGLALDRPARAAA